MSSLFALNLALSSNMFVCQFSYMLVRETSPTSSLQESYLELRQGTTSHLAAALSESSRLMEGYPEPSTHRSARSIEPRTYDTAGFVDTPAVSQLPFCDLLDQLGQHRMVQTPRSPVSARSAQHQTIRKTQRPPSHFYRLFREARKPAVEFDFRNL